MPLLDTWYTGEQTDKLVPYSGSVDPRIDFTIGRPGIPYLDWGVHPGDDWIRNPSADGHFSPKKNVYAQAQKGTYSDVSAYWAPTELTANNVNLMRFSDVLLMAAEAEIEVGSTAKALEYVNRVRSRVKDHQSTWVQKTGTFNPATYTYSGDTTSANFAGNYHIGLYTAAQFADKDFATKAVRFERRLELAMEGHRFFDLKRWDNGTGTMADILNAYAKRETPYETYSADKVFVKGKSENFPIPQDQIDLANNQGKEVLKQNPGY